MWNLRNVIISFVCLISCFGPCLAQESIDDHVLWKFQTQGKIFSAPAYHNGTVFIGSADGYLYALNADNGKLLWKFHTGFPVSSTPLLLEDKIVVESGNQLFAIDFKGFQSWCFNDSDTTGTAPLDNWDLHHSSPILHENVIYYGSGDGHVYGVKMSNGAGVFKVASEGNSPIRTTPAIADGMIYFGDWNGKLYGVELANENIKWNISTFEERPYPNFGPIIYNMYTYEGLVYYGARNPHIMALNGLTGKEIWSFTDPGGSWIPGNAIVSEGVLYMGGSDNHKMLAFNAKTGTLLWSFDATQNIYSKPILTKDQIIFSTFYSGYGDPKPENEGSIFVVEKSTGKEIKRVEFQSKIIASSLLEKNKIYVGSTDHFLYCIDAKKLLGKK